MDDNPFAPPRSEVDAPNRSPEQGSVWKGVLIGCAIDMGGTIVLGIIISAAWMMLHFSPEMSPAEMESLAAEFAQEASQLSSVWGLTSIILGSAISLLAGYVCARFAHNRWKSATVILGILMGAFAVVSSLTRHSALVTLGFGLLTFAVVYAGGWLREGRRSEKAT